MHHTVREAHTHSRSKRTPRRGTTAIIALVLATALALLGPVGTASHEPAGDAPRIELVDPVSGGPQTYVTIEGEGFGENDTVTFGGSLVAHTYENSNLLGFYAPEAAPGSYEIGVMNDNGSDLYCCFELTDEAPTDSNVTEPDDDDGTTPGDDEDTTCRESGFNVQCNEFGIIRMPNQENVVGDVITVEIEVTLETNYENADAREMMFAVRNVTAVGDSPIELSLNSISTPNGEIYTTKIDQVGANELNIWVAVQDVPTGVPITISVDVGATARGAYVLEALVMPFDRGYEPVKDRDGEDVSLYSFTLLGVNSETGSLQSDGGLSFRGVPGPGVALVLAALALTGVTLRGRRR